MLASLAPAVGASPSVIAVMNSCSGDLRSRDGNSIGELQYIPIKDANAANRVVSFEEITHSHMQTICGDGLTWLKIETPLPISLQQALNHQDYLGYDDESIHGYGVV